MTERSNVPSFQVGFRRFESGLVLEVKMKIKFGLKIRFKDTTTFKDIMTEEYALEIKELRKTGTWRYVSEVFGSRHQELDIDEGNQIDGMDLCKSAAAYLGEDEDSDDWN